MIICPYPGFYCILHGNRTTQFFPSLVFFLLCSPKATQSHPSERPLYPWYFFSLFEGHPIAVWESTPVGSTKPLGIGARPRYILWNWKAHSVFTCFLVLVTHHHRLTVQSLTLLSYESWSSINLIHGIPLIPVVSTSLEPSLYMMELEGGWFCIMAVFLGVSSLYRGKWRMMKGRLQGGVYWIRIFQMKDTYTVWFLKVGFSDLLLLPGGAIM